jgi:hypothetical protein
MQIIINLISGNWCWRDHGRSVKTNWSDDKNKLPQFCHLSGLLREHFAQVLYR